jgi:hypothetical protein
MAAKTKTRATAPKPTSRKPDNPEQFRRFVETAKEIGVDEDPEALDRAFRKVVQPKNNRS